MTINSSNISSLRAHQDALSSSADNIANVNSDGYSPSTATITQDSTDSVVAQITQLAESENEKSKTNLSRELTEQIIIKNGFESNLKAIETQDAMLGALIDIKA